MNPRFSAAEVVEEPLVIQASMGQAGVGARPRRRQTLELMEEVGLSPKLASRSPLELSGGERRRLAIARALSVKPSLLILDEALAGLDLPLQAHLANLLMELQRSYNLAYLYISHDLRLSSYLADRIAIMKDGQILECGPVSQIFFQPKHSYTSRLVSLIPLLYPGEFDPRRPVELDPCGSCL
jgi:ABC-type dipeptide/oligopeptide/nickel transport system ATPase subunit